jgi:predicted dehydrogenase
MTLLKVEQGSRLRYGLIGPGTHATEQLLPALAEMEGAELVAVAARRAERARAAAIRWGALMYTGEWIDLLDQGAVDAIVVAGTPELHAEVLQAGLERGVSVFAEKPPAPNTTALEQLVVAERRAKKGAIAFVGFNFPYGASYVKLQEALGSRGEIRRFDIRMVSSKPLEAARAGESIEEALLYGLGLHAIDLALRSMGVPDSVDVARAQVDTTRMSLTISLGYTDGRLATVNIGNSSNRLEYRCEIVTADGTTGVLDQHNTLVLAEAGRNPRRAVLDGKETVRYEWPSRRGGYARTGYLPELGSFQESVTRGMPSSSSLAASLQSYEVIDRALAA